MKRKSAPKSKSVKKAKIHANSYVRYTFIGISVLVILIVLSLFAKATGKVFVLGSSTASVMLADQGDQSDQPEESDQPDTNQNEEHQGSTSESQSAGQDSTAQQSTSDHGTSPDNQNEKTNEQQAEPTHITNETTQGHLEVQTEGNKGELSIETAGTHIEMKREDNGSVKITAHKADGTEVQLQTNALDQINESLKEKDVEVSTSSAKGFSIKSAGVQAETNFPLSLNPTTKSLSVTTSNGTTADVTTLPNQAVQNVIKQGALTNVLSIANQKTAAAGSNNVTLTELNSQPVYAIQGVSAKNLLGLFPIAYRKTVYVSAQNGQIVQVQQSFLNQLLQALSF